jgi:glucosamine 6-phosphate synthetase-like amidotransferase/phosphosugar isomerase protein
MCGIVGMIHYRDHGFDYDSKQALWPMMLLNSMRGAHSTGLFGVQKETKKDIVEWVKRVGPPHGLMSEPESKKFMDRMFSRYHAVVAHGRYATTGKINAKNAHPFHHGNIILVHNGSVRNLRLVLRILSKK